ncbi:MAG TPA: sugar ABC transporter permease [Clostridiales bacterium]|nr:sugar ABC transporter permease [Clostridiales bacterium]
MNLWTQIRKRWQLFMFLIPAVTYILIFAYYPMFGVQIAFKDFAPGLGIWGSPWAGLKHFEKFFKSYQFTRVLLNTLRLSIYSLVVNTPLAIMMALAINTVRNVKFKKTVQTITYMPHFISVVVLVGMLVQMLNPIMGLYGNLFRLFGGSGYPKDILTQARAFPHLYVWSGTWQGLGWSTIIYIAALSSVDLELHEAAQIEGATRLKRIRYIDFPTLLPTASIMLVLNAGSIMNVGFEKVFLMQNSTNLSLSEVISTYVYNVGMSAGGQQFSYASAIGLFNSIINCIILVVVNSFSHKIDNGASLF